MDLITREILQVGSYPADSAEEAMDEMMSIAGPHLAQLPDGEVDRPSWIVRELDDLRADPDLRSRTQPQASDFSDYEHFPVFRTVRFGHRLNPDNIPLPYAANAHASWPVFDAVRTQHQRPDLALQVGIPGPWALPMFAFQSRPLAVAHRGAFNKANIREIENVFHDPTIGRTPTSGERQVVFQLEVPAEVIAVSSLPKALQAGAARFFGRSIARHAARAPEGAAFGIHYCNGDLGNKAYIHPDTTQAVVRLANEVTNHWPDGRPLRYIHVPLAAGDTPPPSIYRQPGFYRPLAKLELPEETRFFAGFVHEAVNLKTQRTLRNYLDGLVKRHVDIAQACGSGRRSREVARELLKRSVLLAEDIA